MNIQINDKYWLRSDSRQWKIAKYGGVYKTGPDKGKDIWDIVAYCGTPEQAVKSLCHRLIREDEAQTLADAVKAVERVCTEVRTALSPEFEITVK